MAGPSGQRLCKTLKGILPPVAKAAENFVSSLRCEAWRRQRRQ